MSLAVEAPAVEERWTIVAEDGLAMFREDLLTEAEARAYAAANPRTPNGTPQVAVPESVAREAGRRWTTIHETHEAAKRAERRLALASIREAHGV